MSTIIESVFLERMSCNKCGAVFALNLQYVQYARSNAGGYWCPYCDCRWSWSEHKTDRLLKQLEVKERELHEAKCETLRQNQLREQEQIAREKAEKKLRRVNNGVCPCCKRSFTNLARHMKTKHPKSHQPQEQG